ncbi:MAG: gliding motility-associated C-terminal domain-containing protein, partial [Chitinophagaceae bacterium]
CPLDSITLRLSNTVRCDTLYFPNAFTPNGDHRNDVFKSAYNHSIRKYRLTIFNRWGNLVFTTSNGEKGWDGIYNGKEQGTGVYVWLATYTTALGKQKTQKGVVTLLR